MSLHVYSPPSSLAWSWFSIVDDVGVAVAVAEAEAGSDDQEITLHVSCICGIIGHMQG